MHTYESFQTIERYREYRDCGFTEILFAGEDKYTGELFETSKLKKMLDMAADTDLKAIMDDDGTKLLYDAAQANNKAVQDTARYVTGYVYESSDVIVGGHGNDATEELLVLPNAYLQNCRAQSDVLVNTLKNDTDIAVMLLNLRDPYEKYANAVHIEFTQKREEIRIVKGGELLTVQTQNNALDILLEPGEAVWILGL